MVLGVDSNIEIGKWKISLCSQNKTIIAGLHEKETDK